MNLKCAIHCSIKCSKIEKALKPQRNRLTISPKKIIRNFGAWIYIRKQPFRVTHDYKHKQLSA